MYNILLDFGYKFTNNYIVFNLLKSLVNYENSLTDLEIEYYNITYNKFSI